MRDRNRIAEHLAINEDLNGGDYLTIVIGKIGHEDEEEEVVIIRTYFKHDNLIDDMHDIMIDGTIVKECADMYEVADWIIERVG